MFLNNIGYTLMNVALKHKGNTKFCVEFFHNCSKMFCKLMMPLLCFVYAV